jgi:putative ABC transport system permease protein
VYVALRELRRAKLRFGLLTGAVGLLVFLILFQQTLLGSLVGAITGAVESQSADVLVLAADARGQLDASVLEPEIVDEVADVEGVVATAPWHIATFSASTAASDVASDELIDVTLVGHDPDGPGRPAAIEEGRQATADGEAVAPTGYEDQGLVVGGTVRLADGDEPIEVVGLADGLEYSVQPALFVTVPAFEAAVLARSADAPFVPVNAVAVEVAEDVTDDQVAAVQAEVEEAMAGTRAFTRQEAADGIPGVDAIGQSFGVILLLAFAVVGLVTGIFFLILTVQKAEPLTLLRAIGASTRDVLTPLLVQVVLVTVGGVVLGTALLAAVAAVGPSSGLELQVDPVLAATTGAGVLGLGLLASVAAVRRVLAIEPFEVTTRGGVGGGP